MIGSRKQMLKRWPTVIACGLLSVSGCKSPAASTSLASTVAPPTVSSGTPTNQGGNVQLAHATTWLGANQIQPATHIATSYPGGPQPLPPPNPSSPQPLPPPQGPAFPGNLRPEPVPPGVPVYPPQPYGPPIVQPLPAPMAAPVQPYYPPATATQPPEDPPSNNPFVRVWRWFKKRQDNFDYAPIAEKKARYREELPYSD